MVVKLADRVSESAQATGTGSFTLGGPSETQYIAFSTAFTTGDLISYVAVQGEKWEIGTGTLLSETQLSRDFVWNTSDQTGINSQNIPGSSLTKISFDSGTTITIFVGLPSHLVLALDENGDLLDPSPFRNVVFIETLTDMKALSGLTDGETVVVTEGEVGGIFKWDATDSTAADDVDTFRNDNSSGVGLHKRVSIRVQASFNGSMTVDAAATGDSYIDLFTAKKASNATKYFRWLTDAANNAVRLASRLNQGSLTNFLSIYSTGDNADRVAFDKPSVLATRSDAQGIKNKTLAWLSGVSRLVMATADAANNTTEAAYKEIPLTKGGFIVSDVIDVYALKQVDPVIAGFADGDRAIARGANTISGNSSSGNSGNTKSLVYYWASTSTATADDIKVVRPSVGAAASGNGRWLLLVSDITKTMTSGDASPSVKGCEWLITAGSTAITNFDDGYEGQIITIERASADIVITHDPTKINLGGQNRTLTATSPRASFRLVGSVWKSIDGADIADRILDEDDFASDSTTKAPSQQSAAAYISNNTLRTAKSKSAAAAKSYLASIQYVQTEFYDPTFSTPSTLKGGALYRRISLTDLTGYPTSSYFRSVDRYLPDGTTDATNGGYWVISNSVLTPEMFGARGDDATSTDGAAIQDALDTAVLLGSDAPLPVELGAGVYLSTSTLKVYAQSILHGKHFNQTFIKAATGSDIGLLETDGFLSLINTTTKYITDPGMTWGFDIRGITFDGNRQNNFGGVSGTRYGGAGSATWDGFGVRLYGRRYIFRDCCITNTAGIGFYSECGSPASLGTSYQDSRNDQQGEISNVTIVNTSFEGWVYSGPGDIVIDNVTVGLACYPDTAQFGVARSSLMFPSDTIDGAVFIDNATNSAVSGCELGMFHSHTHKNGVGIRMTSLVFQRIKAENLISEGSLSGIKINGTATGMYVFDKFSTRNLNYGDGSRPDFDIELATTSSQFTCASYENRQATGNAGSTKLRIGGSNTNGVHFGNVDIQGGTAGHGVVIESGVSNVSIDRLFIKALTGTAYDTTTSKALYTKSGANKIVVACAHLIENDIGWYNDASQEVVIRDGLIKALSGQTPVTFNTALDIRSLRKNQFLVDNNGTLQYANAQVLVTGTTATFDPTITTEQSIVINHSMWRTPVSRESNVLFQFNGSVPATIQYSQFVSASSTSVTWKVKLSAAGTGNTAGGTTVALII